MTITTATTSLAPEIHWLSVYDPHTGSATRIVGALVTDGDDHETLLHPTDAAEPWRDRTRTTPDEYFADANGQTRGVIEATPAEIGLTRDPTTYTLNELAALASLAAVGHHAT